MTKNTLLTMFTLFLDAYNQLCQKDLYDCKYVITHHLEAISMTKRIYMTLTTFALGPNINSWYAKCVYILIDTSA